MEGRNINGGATGKGTFVEEKMLREFPFTSV
jgi:hypothetical protein